MRARVRREPDVAQRAVDGQTLIHFNPTADSESAGLNCPGIDGRLWAALGRVESRNLNLRRWSRCLSRLELDGCQHIQRRVATLAAVEDL